MGYSARVAELKKQSDLDSIRKYATSQIGGDPVYAAAKRAREGTRAGIQRSRTQDLARRGYSGGNELLRSGARMEQEGQVQEQGMKAQRTLQMVQERKDEIMTKMKINENEYSMLLEKLSFEAAREAMEEEQRTEAANRRWGGVEGVMNALTFGIGGNISKSVRAKQKNRFN